MTFDRHSIPPGATFSTTPTHDGWPLRTYRQSPAGTPRGSILWLGGRGDIVEKYFETIDGWARVGWDVTSFDWRGQGGSGRVGPNPMVGHMTDYAIWIDDLAAFWADWVKRSPAPHIIMGHSMGGHLVLRALAEQRVTPDRAVLIAPMLGFETKGLPFPVAKFVASLLGRLISAARPAWKANEKPSPPSASREAYLTHDHARYDDEGWWKAQKPELNLGPPSWAWLAAAYRSIDGLNRSSAVEAIRVPLLILCADADQLVSPRAIRRYAARIRSATLVTFGPESAHEILREADPVRDRALAEIAKFLD